MPATHRTTAAPRLLWLLTIETGTQVEIANHAPPRAMAIGPTRLGPGLSAASRSRSIQTRNAAPIGASRVWAHSARSDCTQRHWIRKKVQNAQRISAAAIAANQIPRRPPTVRASRSSSDAASLPRASAVGESIGVLLTTVVLPVRPSTIGRLGRVGPILPRR